MEVAKVKGLDGVMRKLLKAKGVTGNAVAYGLIRGGQFLQGLSMDIVPVQTGNLKASAFTRASGKGIHTDVIVGYTAAYSVYVHENLDALHGEMFNIAYADVISKHQAAGTGTVRSGWFLRGKNQQAKFLEQPARQHRKEIIDVVVNEARKRIK